MTGAEIYQDVIHAVRHGGGIVAQDDVFELSETFGHFIVVPSEITDAVVGIRIPVEEVKDIGKENLFLMGEMCADAVNILVEEADNGGIDVGMVVVKSAEQIFADMREFIVEEILMGVVQELYDTYRVGSLGMVDLSADEIVDYHQKEIDIYACVSADLPYCPVSESEWNRKPAEYGKDVEISVDQVDQRVSCGEGHVSCGRMRGGKSLGGRSGFTLGGGSVVGLLFRLGEVGDTGVDERVVP